MTEVATSMTSALNAGPDGPSIDDLLNTGTFHQRLAAARAEREKVLAARSSTEPQFLPGPKPWERPEYLRGELRKTKREAPAKISRPHPPTAVPSVVVPVPRIAEAPTVQETAAVVLPVAEPLPVPSPASRLSLYQVAAGVALGIVVGTGVGFWFASAPAPAPGPVVAVTATGPSVSTPDTATGDAVLMALPSADALPASPDAPYLSNVANVSASLPAITGGGPVGPQMVSAPTIATSAPAQSEAAAPEPAPVEMTALARAPMAAPVGGVPETRFAGMTAPQPVSFALPRAAMPTLADSAPAPLPNLPGSLSQPASFEMPQAVAPAAGDTPLAAQGTPLPVSRPAPADGVRLIVHAPATLTDAEIATASDAFAAAGFDTIEPKPVDFTVKETNVRFFFPADKADAVQIAEALGANVRDFTGFSPQPPQGTIEIWLAGRGTATPAAAAVKPAKAAKAKKVRSANGPSQVQILKDRLVRQLRAGALN